MVFSFVIHLPADSFRQRQSYNQTPQLMESTKLSQPAIFVISFSVLGNKVYLVVTLREHLYLGTGDKCHGNGGWAGASRGGLENILHGRRFSLSAVRQF